MKRKRSKRNFRLVAQAIKRWAATGRLEPEQQDVVLVAMAELRHAHGVRNWRAIERAIDRLAGLFFHGEGA